MCLVLQQTAAPAPWVVLVRRQGVAQPAAAAQLQAVRTALATSNAEALPAGDLSKCQRKLACLVKEAKGKGASLLVTIESARVVDQSIVKVDLLSIEEDGRKLESFVAEGPSATIVEVLSTKAREVLVPAVKRASGVVEVPVAPPVLVTPKEAPVVLPKAPPPPPLIVSAPAPSPTGPGLVRWLPGIVGVAAAGAGVGVFLSAGAERTALQSGGLMSTQVRPLVETGKTKEALGLGLMAGGGAAVLASVIWVLVAPSTTSTVSIVPGVGGGSVVVGGTF